MRPRRAPVSRPARLRCAAPVSAQRSLGGPHRIEELLPGRAWQVAISPRVQRFVEALKALDGPVEPQLGATSVAGPGAHLPSPLNVRQQPPNPSREGRL